MQNNASFPRPRALAAAASLVAACAAHAQSDDANAARTAAAAPSATVVITGNPLGSAEVAAPSSTLSGDRLVQARGSSLGQTLADLPGVSSSYFGPNANRPVIRGQDGDRIRLLSNAGASLDASSLSFDHAVPIDPLVVERLEVLRGPAALLYGGSAIGGVVNAIDNRIPRAPLAGVSGAAELRAGGAAGERGASGLLEAGSGAFALHADAFQRRTDDLRVPAFDRPLDDGSSERRSRVANSQSDAQGGAVGASAVWDRGYLGASVDTYRNDYGVVAEEDVTLRMRRDKLSLAGEARALGGFFSTVRGQLGFTDYQHEEVEGSGDIGTTFKNRGGDGRLELVHARRPLGAGHLQGVFGLQAETSRFQALGEEAFVPTTRTRQAAAFVLEQWALPAFGEFSAGVRLERARVASDGDADPAEARFGPAQTRRFSPRSASAAAVLHLTPQWQLSANAAYTERAPTSYELFANGVHAATGSYERGDVNQAKERGRNLDLGLQWKRVEDHARLGAFISRFSNYIALMRTGEPDFVDDEGAHFPVYAFRGVPAQLYGLELEARKRLLEGGATLDLEGHVDWVRGDNRATGEPLPRIAPLRAKVALEWQQGAWTTGAELEHAARQSRVPGDDSPTPAWTMVHLSARYKLKLGDADALLFARLNNLGDELAYNAGTLATVRPLSPLPGRALMAGMRVTF
ncbi:MAG: TonB-dependent receptor [Pseudomonadota bacterium]